MKHSFIIFLFISINSIAQISYEKGYFIENNNSRTDCLIKNEDWLRNPSSVKYKLESSSEPLTISINSLKEFAVSRNKYIRTLVQMDTSSQNNKTLTTSRKPLWRSKEAVLKVLVEGKGNLYYYDDKELVLIFYSVDGSPIEQLEYKTYFLQSNGNYAATQTINNLTYINQLKTKVSCGEEFSKIAQSKIKYTRDFLTDYFIRYNKCSGGSFVNFKTDTTKFKRFHLKITPGLDFSAAKIQLSNGPTRDFPAKELNFRMGIEAEFILPFNKNKWAIFIEPTYQSHESTARTEIKYSSIEVPFGLRHFFYLGNDYSIFINVAMVLDMPLEYSAKLPNGVTLNSNSIKINFAGGAGFAYKRLSLEGRYYTFRTGLDESNGFHFDFTKVSIVFGYRLF